MGIKIVPILLFLLMATSLTTLGQDRKEFVHKYKKIAIEEMERVKIPASIKLAQGILESGCGKSLLAREANNHFGIKCHTTWDGAKFMMDDDEKNECFRKYKNPEQSWIDHSEFLTSRDRYADLFKLDITDYKGWAKGLKAAGYATNPIYADLLIKIIEEEKLYLIDKKEYQIIEERNNEITYDLANTNTIPNYSKREELRNNIKCIIIEDGDTMDKIALYYNISTKRLQAYNELSSLQVEKGDIIYLKSKKTKAARGFELHQVKGDETIEDIAQMYGVKQKNLLKYNYLTKTDKIAVGEKIYLRAKAPLF